jgi:CheY-like chemotaxis protein
MPANETPALQRVLDGVYVLVVEDYEDARTLYTLLLTMHGAIVVAAASVDEALEALDRTHFDVLVSDVNMPGDDGYDLIRQVRLRSRDSGGAIPAVAVTAETHSLDRAGLFAAGFNEYIPKPVDTVALLQCVLSLLGRRPYTSSA